MKGLSENSFDRIAVGMREAERRLEAWEEES